MQLKKRFSVRKGVAVGAIAVAMFTASMPAMASNGLGIGRGSGIGLSLHAEADMDARVDTGLKADFKELKSLYKDVRSDLKALWKVNRLEADATSSAQVAARKQCRKAAKDGYTEAVVKARAERDSGLKSAVGTYLSALKSARGAYHASIDVSATTTPASLEASAAARATYRLAVENAQKAFRASKAGVMTGYRADLEAARAAQETAKEACKP